MNTPSSTLPREPDDRFLRRFLSGEASALKTVVGWARETAYFRGFGLSREEREDAVQDALAQLWTLAARPGFEPRRGLRAVLRAIVAARCIDRVRRTKKWVELDESMEDPSPTPYEAFVAGDDSARLRLALVELDQSCREVIRMRFFDGLDYSTMAAREQRAESTLRVRLFGCLRALRSRMQRMRG